jgi:hypothetical protein
MSAKGGLSCRSQEKRAGDQIKCVVSHGNQQNDFAQRIHERDVRTINKRPRLGPISLPFPSVHPGGQQRERPLREMQRSQGVGDGKAGGLSQSSRFNGKSHRGVTCRTLDTGPWEAVCLAVAAGAQTQTQLGGRTSAFLSTFKLKLNGYPHNNLLRVYGCSRVAGSARKGYGLPPTCGNFPPTWGNSPRPSHQQNAPRARLVISRFRK